MTTASKARVLITLRPEILDVQGQTIQTSLQSLGFSNVKSIRVGKVVEIEMTDALTSASLESIQKMSRELLANPIIEDFKVEVI